MAKSVKIASFTKTTNGTVAVPTGFLPNLTGQRRADYIFEVVSVGTGDTWNIACSYTHPVGSSTAIGTFADATNAGVKAFTWAYAESTAATDMISLPINIVTVTAQTAGSSSIVANLYIVTDGP